MTTTQHAAVTPYPPRSRGRAEPRVAVLGAGIAGLAAAHRLADAGYAVDLFEKRDHVGGHCASHSAGGFTFDEGPHISFTSRPEIQQLLAGAVGENWAQRPAKVVNYWQTHWLPHPAQCHLFGLPIDQVQRCVLDFIHSRRRPPAMVENYADWCRNALGSAFSEAFTFRYTRKFWTVEPIHMATDWIGPRVYQPSIDEVVRGALSPQQTNYHYVTNYRYPKTGGFVQYMRAFDPVGQAHLGQRVVLIDMARRQLELADGTTHGFDRLISSLPLPELVRCMSDVPEEIRDAADRLVCTSVALVNVGVGRADGFPDADWIYVYDEDIPFARVSFPHRFAPANAPPGCGSIQVEIYYSLWRPIPARDVVDWAMSAMRGMGLLRAEDAILLAERHDLSYANVLFDKFRAESLAAVRAYLDSVGIACCGRYGRWEYLWTDDSILSGWQAADETITTCPLGRWTLSGGRRR